MDMHRSIITPEEVWTPPGAASVLPVLAPQSSRTASAFFDERRAELSFEAFGKTGMHRELESIQRQLSSDLPLRVWAGSASILSAGVSVACFLWLVRGGSVLSGLFSSVPACRLFDPLPILEQLGTTQALIKDQQGIEELIRDAAGN
jgi:hypothetical protein